MAGPRPGGAAGAAEALQEMEALERDLTEIALRASSAVRKLNHLRGDALEACGKPRPPAPAPFHREEA